MHWLFAPGFFSNGPVHVALVVGAVVSVVAPTVGLYVVARRQGFAGHALTDVATTGGAGAFLVGATPLVGFVTGSLVGAGAMDALGARHSSRRDVATGVTLGAASGLSALFLYLASTTSATGTSQQILFGSVFTTSPRLAAATAVLGALTLLVVAASARPLLLSSLSNDLAAARGINVRLIEALFTVTLAVAVGLSSLVLGSILSTALLIGPPAVALRVATSWFRAWVVAVVTALLATWLGVVLSYDSPSWNASRRSLPVSFFIVVVVIAAYLAAHLPSRTRSSTARAGRN